MAVMIHPPTVVLTHSLAGCAVADPCGAPEDQGVSTSTSTPLPSPTTTSASTTAVLVATLALGCPMESSTDTDPVETTGEPNSLGFGEQCMFDLYAGEEMQCAPGFVCSGPNDCNIGYCHPICNVDEDCDHGGLCRPTIFPNVHACAFYCGDGVHVCPHDLPQELVCDVQDCVPPTAECD